ncbi:MAG TPA: hypothetical protein VGC72_06030 [Candidatus Elarobacter sp.]
MQVTANGWGRDSGSKLIVATELEEGYRPDKRSYSPGKTYVKVRSTGVEILKGPCEFTLGGKYLVTVTLTNGDLLRLFVEAFRKGISYKTMGIMKDHAATLSPISTDDDEDED